MARSIALTDRHTASAKSRWSAIESTREAAASTMQTMRAEKPSPGHRVATECFPWLRSRSLSHTAMLMQLSEQRVAKSNAANVTVDLPVIDIASEKDRKSTRL